MRTTEVIITIVLTSVTCGLIIGLCIWWCIKTSKFDNYDNRRNIKKAQKKFDKLVRKRKPNYSKIELAQKKLDKEKLFSNCQRLRLSDYNGASGSVLFSDDNEVMMFFHDFIPYSELASYSIVENKVTNSYTKTKPKGVIPRAMVGGAIAGGVGAVVGSMTASSESNTTYYQTTEGFYFQLFLKNKTSYTIHLRGSGFYSNKIPQGWRNLAEKIQMIIDS